MWPDWILGPDTSRASQSNAPRAGLTKPFPVKLKLSRSRGSWNLEFQDTEEGARHWSPLLPSFWIPFFLFFFGNLHASTTNLHKCLLLVIGTAADMRNHFLTSQGLSLDFFFFFSMMLAKDEMQGPKIYLCIDFQHSFIIKGYLFGQKFLLLEILSSMSAVISLHSLLIEIYKMLRCLLDKNLHISSI